MRRAEIDARASTRSSSSPGSSASSTPRSSATRAACSCGWRSRSPPTSSPRSCSSTRSSPSATSSSSATAWGRCTRSSARAARSSSSATTSPPSSACARERSGSRAARSTATAPRRDVIAAYMRRVGSRQTADVASIATEVERIGGEEAHFVEAALTDRGGYAARLQVALDGVLDGAGLRPAHPDRATASCEVGISSTRARARGHRLRTSTGHARRMALDPGRHHVRVKIDATAVARRVLGRLALHRRPGLTLDWVELRPDLHRPEPRRRGR